IRLWSTVVSHEVSRPSFQSERYGATLGTSTFVVVSALAIALRELVVVGDERCDLVVRPVAPDRGHPPEAVAEEHGEPLRVRQQRVAAERRADVRGVEPVA